MTYGGASLWSTVSPPRTTSAKMPATRPTDSVIRSRRRGRRLSGATTTSTMRHRDGHVDQAVPELDPGVVLEGGHDAGRGARRPIAATEAGPGQADGPAADYADGQGRHRKPGTGLAEPRAGGH